jgi:methyl coenzyme M reductase alpha subunit
MKFYIQALTAAAAAAALAATVSVAFAQNSPGVPGGILSDEFHFQDHPQLQFAASAPTGKYQKGAPSQLRKRGDNGDPDGCNLKCPDDPTRN